MSIRRRAISKKRNSNPQKDEPGFVYVYERDVTRTEPTSSGRADLTSNTTFARSYPLDVRCCLEFLVEFVFKILDPSFVSLGVRKRYGQQVFVRPTLNARYSYTSCLEKRQWCAFSNAVTAEYQDTHRHYQRTQGDGPHRQSALEEARRCCACHRPDT